MVVSWAITIHLSFLRGFATAALAFAGNGLRRPRARGLCLAGLLALAGAALAADPLMPITLATAGPGNLSHLPVDLMRRIGADRAEGVQLAVRYFGGGPLAYQDMLAGNSDFAVAGAPALAGLAVKGKPVVSIATVNRVPTFVLMVRRDLHGRVRGLADLKGRVIGVNTSSMATKSTSQQVAEFILRRAGIKPQEVHFVPAGQSYEAQRDSLLSGAVDALMGDEPFASRLQQEKLVFALADLHDPQTSRKAMGGLFLNAQLATRRDVLEKSPEKAQRMARVLVRTLQWIAQHSAEEVVAALAPANREERDALVQLLKRYKNIYSPDGAFTREQIRTAEALFRANQPPDSAAARYDFAAMIDPRFVGLREQ